MAGTISFDGLATGINTSDTVDQLIDVASRPKILQEAEKVRQENQLATWQEINSRLLDLRTPAKDVWSQSTWSTLSASSSNENILTATTSADASTGSYTFTVESLAKNHQISSGTFDSALSSIGTGDITVTRGGESTTITLDAENGTLTGLAEELNNARIGISASVINDGSNYRLLLSADESGVANAISITRDNSVDIFYQRTPSEDKTVTAFTELQEATDATIKFGSSADALTITSASNNVEDVVEGVTLNLVSASPGTVVTLGLGRDTTGVEEKIQTFVDAYNDAMEYVNQQFEYDTGTNNGGILMGDRTLVAIQDRLRGLVASSVNTGGTYQSLLGIGVSLQDDGALAFDTTTFQAAVKEDYDSVAALFRTSGRSDHSKVSFVYAGKKASEPGSAGYELEITQAAERASLTATSDANLTITTGVNDALTLSLDGGSSYSVTLSAGTYTIDDLATELQTKINAGADNDSQVSVSVSGGTKLQITSEVYGSRSGVDLVSGSALSDLGFSAGSFASGSDVAGTINGELATGTGRLLTGGYGNSSTSGVTLEVAMTAQDLTDAGGSVVTSLYYSKGVGNRFDEYLQDLTTPLVGTIGMRETALENTIEDIDERIADMENRLELKRESLLAQFMRMEQAVAEFNSQGSFLANALGGLSANWGTGS